MHGLVAPQKKRKENGEEIEKKEENGLFICEADSQVI